MKENRNMAEKNQVTDNQFQKIVNKVSFITIIRYFSRDGEMIDVS